MKYCSHCGNELKENIKFCPSCGTNTQISKKETEKPLMYKRESKSLKDKVVDFGKKTIQKEVEKRIQDETTNYVKSKFEKTTTLKSSNNNGRTNNVSEFQATENKTSTSKKLNKWTWIYVILNGLLVYLGYQSDEVIGVLLFSVLILAIVFFRRKNEKPYNWFVKIILVVQLIFLVAIVAEKIEYVSVITLLFIGLILTNFILLFKGNNS